MKGLQSSNRPATSLELLSVLSAARHPVCACLSDFPDPPTSPQILETKVRKLEQLVRLKDAKIATLLAKLQVRSRAGSALACLHAN